jgi:hypothetical protein
LTHVILVLILCMYKYNLHLVLAGVLVASAFEVSTPCLDPFLNDFKRSKSTVDAYSQNSQVQFKFSLKKFQKRLECDYK